MNTSVPFLAATFVLLAACASGGRSRCSPVTGEFLAGGPAYRDCEVSVPAEMRTPPRLDAPLRMEGTISCLAAWFEFVVDTNGRIIEPTVKLVRTNSKAWAETVQRAFPDVRYRPAEKGTTKVQQLVRYRPSYAIIVSSTGSGTAARAATAGARANC